MKFHVINWFSFAWTLHPATGRCEGSIWLLVGSLTCLHEWLFEHEITLFRGGSEIIKVLSSQDLWRFGFLFDIFGLKNTKCISTFKESYFLISCYLIAYEVNYWNKNSWTNQIKLFWFYMFTIDYWCFPHSLHLMPQSANCAGKSTDFRNTSTGRFCENKLILLPEH